MYKTGPLFNFLKNAHFLQEVFIKCIARKPWIIDFTVEKIAAFKKAFNFVNVEGVPGDYVEFGVFEGTSMITAFECHRCTMQPENLERKFWGFDSFEGLNFSKSGEHHATYRDGDFKSDFEVARGRLRKCLKQRVRWELVKGYLEETVAGATAPELGIESVAVALFDLDLGAPTKLALDFIKPALHQGSVLIFDEYFWYKGDASKGEAFAFNTFREENPQIEFRHFMDYGVGARIFIVGSVGAPG